MAKVLLSIGNHDIEDIFENTKGIDVVDKERDLETLKDLIEFINVDFLILNRLLDQNGDNLVEIASLAKNRDIKVIMLLDDIEDFSEKKIVTSLVANDVYFFMRFSEINQENILKAINNYPKEFDFGLLQNQEEKKTKEVINKNPKTEIKQDKVYIPQVEEIEVMNNALIGVYSNCSSGKSSITKVISLCLQDRNYKTAVINIDKNYSANMFYGICDEEYEGIFSESIDDAYYKINKNLSIISGPFGSEREVDREEFLKVLNSVRIKNNITIVDCKSELNSLTELVIQQSTLDLFIYDTDVNHFNQNYQLIDKLGNNFVPEKTIAIINNAFLDSDSYKETLKNLKESEFNFKDIVSIRSCGPKIQETMFGTTTPYFDEKSNIEFKNDIDNLLDSMKSRKKELSRFKRLFRGGL